MTTLGDPGQLWLVEPAPAERILRKLMGQESDPHCHSDAGLLRGDGVRIYVDSTCTLDDDEVAWLKATFGWPAD